MITTMPRAKKKQSGGAKIRRQIANANRLSKRPIYYAKEREIYAKVERPLGDRRFNVRCNDRIVRIAHIRGKIRKGTFIQKGDIVLVAIREDETEQNKCDIVHKYTNEESQMLSKRGKLDEQISTIENRKDIDDIIGGVDDDEQQEPQCQAQERQIDYPPSDSDDDYYYN